MSNSLVYVIRSRAEPFSYYAYNGYTSDINLASVYTARDAVKELNENYSELSYYEILPLMSDEDLEIWIDLNAPYRKNE